MNDTISPQVAAPEATGYGTMTIRIDGLTVTLVADGRKTVKHFTTAAEAGRVYDHFKARIQQAEQQ